MKTTTHFTDKNRKKILVADACIYTQSALCNMVLDTIDCFDVTTASGYILKIDEENPPYGIIIWMRSTLTVQMSILKEVVKLCKSEICRGPIVLITDMSLRCAWALLRIAGLPDKLGGNIIILPSRLTPIAMKEKFCLVFNHENQNSPIIKYKNTVSLCQLKTIKSMINGVSEHIQANKLNVNVKTVYNIRRRILQHLDIPGKHAFYCGTFSRRVMKDESYPLK